MIASNRHYELRHVQYRFNNPYIIDIIFRVRFSSHVNGALQIFKNGEKIVNESMPLIGLIHVAGVTSIFKYLSLYVG